MSSDSVVAGAELLSRAAEDAQVAASKSGVEIRLLDTQDEFDEARHVWDTVWPMQPGATEVTSHLLRALVHAGAYVSGAYVDDRIVGACLGVIGRDHRDEQWHTHLHSHVAAALPEFADRGIGTALKVHQRSWALETSLDRIVWTFDPLVRRNARFNLVKLGGVGVEYIENFYGAMTDAVNVGDPSDRVLLQWDIASDRVAAALRGEPAALSRADWIARGATMALDTDSAGHPVVTPATAGTSLVSLPRDIVEIRGSDPAMATAWRHAVRQALSPVASSAARIVALTQESDYVVEVVS
jgi:predicted GNAT superfamily acetyltransferase